MEVNSGIRFDDVAEIDEFIDVLAAELWRRLKGRRGRRLAVRVMIKMPGWTEPTWKWLGHGKADSKQKTRTFTNWVADEAQLRREAKLLYRECGPRDPTDLVGIGLAMEKLEESDAVRRAQLQQATDSVSLSQPTLSQMVTIERTPVVRATSAAAAPSAAVQSAAPQVTASKSRATSSRANTASSKYVKLTLADLDPDTLNDLPPSVRREIMDELAWQKNALPPASRQKPAPPPPPLPMNKQQKRPPSAASHESKSRVGWSLLPCNIDNLLH